VISVYQRGLAFQGGVDLNSYLESGEAPPMIHRLGLNGSIPGTRTGQVYRDCQACARTLPQLQNPAPQSFRPE
jgi:hypothetical protein